MRIITGSARGTKLDTLAGEATRPTTDRVKEAVFSMLQFDIEGRAVLDLFAGSGQLAVTVSVYGFGNTADDGRIDHVRDVNLIVMNVHGSAFTDVGDIILNFIKEIPEVPVLTPAGGNKMNSLFLKFLYDRKNGWIESLSTVLQKGAVEVACN